MVVKDSTTRQRRLALLTILTWWSSQQQEIEASIVLQHRVKSSQRTVPYHHVLSGQPRNGPYARVHHNYRSHAAAKRRLPLHKETHDDEDLWVLHVSAGEIPTDTTSSREKRRLGGGSSSQQSETTFWRRLFDQFVGQEVIPGLDTINRTNVTTEVEFESIVDGSNTSQAKENEGDNNASSSSSHTSNNVTTVTGNATEAGNITESVVYTKPTDSRNSTMNTNSSDTTTDNLTTPEFQPLRIRAILAEDSGKGNLLNVTERNALFHDMLSPALLAWSSSLRVDPVVGNLTVDVNQLLDGETCGPGIDSGLPSIQVPLHHLDQGIPDTDMIIYLSLGFAVTPFNASDDSEEALFDRTFGGIPINSVEGIDIMGELKAEDLMVDVTEHTSRDGMGGRIREWLANGKRRERRLSSSSNDVIEPSSIDGRTGQWSEELLSYMNDPNATEPINICTGEYLAAASYCSSDQYDRPTAALLHICIDDTFFHPKHLRRNILTIMHELGHALGFNSLSMAHFRKPDGTPYTPRDKNGNVPEKSIVCTGAETERQIATVPLPSEDILKFKEVRGGVRVAEIVTPSVLQVVRNQFDCQLLTGAELESGEGLPLSVTGKEGCIGDHWERRLFSSDLMNPVVDDLEYTTRISTLTLAYFADSGWYQVDLSNADVASGWGRGSGCSFVNDTCISANGEVPPRNAPFFCNEISTSPLSLSQDIHGCTPDLSRKATCSIGQYNLDLPPAYQYFNSTYGSDVGGSDTFMDFCPIYAGYDNGLCSSKDNEAAIKAFDVEKFGQRNSRCLVGNVRSLSKPTALCLPIACVIQDHSLRIKVEDQWHVCGRPNQTIYSSSVTIECPDPRRVCPTFFCPYDCLGTEGLCDYSSGKCLCEYHNSTGNGDVIQEDCVKVKELKEMEGSTLRPILRPDEPGKRDPAVPPPDHTLSDYYVADPQSLEESPRLEAYAIAFLFLTGAMIFSFAVMMWYLNKPSNGVGESLSVDFFFFRRHRSGYEEFDGGESPSNPNKDKMVATVLVDMRIRNNERWRRLRGQNANDSIVDTEGRLTESEAASGPESMSDMSSRRSEASSDLDTSQVDINVSQDDINVDSLPPEVAAEPQLVRRRRFLPESNAYSS
ncbi:leishmanolysin-like protease [Nitzschia inconspicua]|uniref:Leishmanolysin-like protease n=1 Tax=Nitzschia inconspicua TaxID=303405 RepID=A0A9K3PEL3_9STRA|nr:leishmanolysin-like protease [Nitzschia inconspicua]